MKNTESTPDIIQGLRHQWQLETPNQDLANEIATALGLPPLIALILTRRQITSPAQAGDFLFSQLKNLRPPHHLPDVHKAVSRIARAIEKGEQIAIYGDYDVDGITATALLVHFLTTLDGKVSYHIPHRILEGYGLNSEALHRMHSQGVTLIITVDCGSSDHEAIRLAGELGLDVIVTDHHQPPEILPSASAMVNPKRIEETADLRNLAGVGVAFYLVAALRTHFRRSGRWTVAAQPNLKKYLDWVALGTVADMVPLTATNRILASRGLYELSRTPNFGLRALKEICGLGNDPVSDWDVSFRLGPRLNAAGRLGSGDLALRLLLSTSRAEARALASELEQLNRQRQLAEDGLLAEVLCLIQADSSLQESSSLVLASPGWHKGLLGLVASRLVERFSKPAILLTQTDQYWEGSGRSLAGFDLHDALARCQDHLVRFGGHRLAAGLALKLEQLTEFRSAFEGAVKEGISPEATSRTLSVDAMVNLQDITPELMAYLEKMQPYGIGNPEPILCCRDFQVVNLRILKGSHLQMRLRQGEASFDAIGFNFVDSDQPPPSPELLVFSPRWNHWQGEKRMQLHIIDYR